jgi:uncharacterized protein (AIM24 family)
MPGVAQPVVMGFPQQLQMGGPTPMDASGFKLADAPWGGESFQVVGEDSQALFVVLQPGQSLMTEPGGMLQYLPGVDAKCDTGGLGMAVQRVICAGESCFRVHWTNNTSSPVSVAVGPSFPAKVIVVDLDKEGGELNIKKMSWLASLGSSTEFGFQQAPSLLAGCFGGQGFCLTTLKGKGKAFLNAGGTVIVKTLQAGQSIVIDTSSLVAWSKSVTFEVKLAGNCMTVCCGGMGMFNTRVTGPGLVFIQSMPFEKAAMAYLMALRPGGKGGVATDGA